MKMKSYLIKTDHEVNLIRKACEISSQLHTLAMKEDLSFTSEQQLAKMLDQYKQNFGNTSWAYPIIIGSGQRATQLHAKPTSKKIKKSELMLIDMGVRYQGFCSDVTRTWPVDHRFTKEQRDIYKIVLSTQKEIINKIRPYETLESLHHYCKESLLDKLLSKKIIKKSDINEIYPHKTSHWIGRKVHDECPYYYQDNSPIQLSPGMVFTVEPGLYFKKINSIYTHIGVRIEDVILVTKNGSEVLTNLPKEIDEIEYLRSQIK